MENKIQIFNFNNDEVRTILVHDEPYFVGKDVADVLGYKNGSRDVNAHVDDEDMLKYRISTAGQMREQIIINESGVYSMIFGSELDSAKQFKHWVTKEVLPTLRKTGTYTVDNSFFLFEDAESIRKEQEAKNARNNGLARNAITKQARLIYDFALQTNDPLQKQRLVNAGSQLLLDNLYMNV